MVVDSKIVWLVVAIRVGSTNGISDEVGSSSSGAVFIGVFVKIFQGIAFISEVASMCFKYFACEKN